MKRNRIDIIGQNGNDGLHYKSNNIEEMKEIKEDKIVNTVIEAYKKRSNVGIDKYGTTLSREDLSSLDWLQHLQEELMDATLYIEALKYKIDKLHNHYGKQR